MKMTLSTASLTAKATLAALVLSMTASLLPTQAKACDDPDTCTIAWVIGAASLSTLALELSAADKIQTGDLIQEAYNGSGEKLDALARVSGLPVEVVADRIVELDRSGQISDSNPAQTTKVLEAAFAPASK